MLWSSRWAGAVVSSEAVVGSGVVVGGGMVLISEVVVGVLVC